MATALVVRFSTLENIGLPMCCASSVQQEQVATVEISLKNLGGTKLLTRQGSRDPFMLPAHFKDPLIQMGK